ncbi:uncharacterized protein LOC108896454 isoform X2 [Lates calcarifer]|uniref:Uncharacterized protein LOC108896454 isoform X2 n=1 Tax=Lates calcarifer TaxID=8187 RepID=A0AAJ8DPS5_LATCA|nr:uncharacterized protein LOC108896454 isoform X2 [Lates calcarifer]
MDRLHIFLVILSGVVSCSQDQTSQSVLEVTVRPGDNITLYCDCKISTGVYIVWYRNCSHEKQPTLVLSVNYNAQTGTTKTVFPHFTFLRNFSSLSYDLLIMNITDSDEGLYYCGTKQPKVEEDKYISQRHIYSYGNITTRILLNSSKPHHHQPQQDCSGSCWMLLFSLCPVFAVLSSLLTSLVVYQLCQKKAEQPQVDQERLDTRGQRRLNQDEDVCYAALEIRQPSQRPKKKKLSFRFQHLFCHQYL